MSRPTVVVSAVFAFALAIGFARPARAQDGGVSGDTGLPDDTGSGAPVRRAWMCPGAVTSQTQPIVFRRTAPIDFGPGTGMRSIGSHSGLGLDYNLLFSGRYDTEMRGQLTAAWPRPITLTAAGDPMGGYLEAWFGLRMTATLWVAGNPIVLPLSFIIDDNEGHGRSLFTPWAWNFEGTVIHLNVSAWRTIYRRTLNVFGSNVEFQLQMRYNVDMSIRTMEIGFPDRSSPSAATVNLAEITAMAPEAIFPPPGNGMLELLTRWRSQIRYRGSLEFQIVPRCADSLDLACRVATGLLGSVLRSVSTGAIVESRDVLPDPFDQSPRYTLPVQHVESTYIDFGDVRVGQTVELPIVIDNPGAAPLATQSSASPASEFRVATTEQCVPPGGVGRIPVTFTPPRIGSFRSEILLDSNGTLGTPMRVTLIGNGAMETRPAVAQTDGGRRSGDGGRRYAGDIEGGCQCRVGRSTRTPGSGAAAIAFACCAMFVLGARTGRRRARR